MDVIAYLVEVGLDAVNLLLVFEKTEPVLLVELFLVQVQLVVDLALLGINLGEQIHVDVVAFLLSE